MKRFVPILLTVLLVCAMASADVKVLFDEDKADEATGGDIVAYLGRLIDGSTVELLMCL